MSKDTNVMVAAAACGCLAGIARGLRAKFAPHIPAVVPALLEKCKERKKIAADAFADLFDAVYNYVSQGGCQLD